MRDTPWDIPSLEFLLQYDVPYIKIASATITNEEQLKMATKSRKPLLISTGMSTIEEIDQAVDILECCIYSSSRGNKSIPLKNIKK